MDLRVLFEQHYASIWRLLRRLGVPLAQIDDATQEVFWIAARRLTDIKQGRAHSFLYGVALRVASNQIRRSPTLKNAALDDFPHLADPRPSPEENCEQEQLRKLLDGILLRMPDELREVFVLCELEGLQVNQFAELVDIPVGTASSRLRRAREEFSAITRHVRAALQSGKRYG
jgi:RNA polymerase sigma-70 factor (ECF subfamily)